MRSSFEYLEGTKKEADMIAEDMKQHRVPYIYYSGIDGTEESFKQQDGTRPKLMHIATHGFFLTEKEAEKSQFARSKKEIFTERYNRVGLSMEDKSMTRTGLLFSGCNHAIQHEQIPESEEDGILTAKEISRLDFNGLDLVVLSACQTGLGEITGEGVFGLQRGFKKAGAQTIVMSLWKVADESTQLLMVEFFKHLTAGQSKRAAFIAAQKTVREKYPNPLHWAAFVMVDGME
jgi:CHAT domain-containing protein